MKSVWVRRREKGNYYLAQQQQLATTALELKNIHQEDMRCDGEWNCLMIVLNEYIHY
jgi:hypothetical protein